MATAKSKSTKPPSKAPRAAKRMAGKPKANPPKPAASLKASTAKSGGGASKQDTVLAMLRTAKGATISAIEKTTGWQPHSVRGFLAGTVKKKLELTLTSTMEGDQRVYRIAKVAA